MAAEPAPAPRLAGELPADPRAAPRGYVEVTVYRQIMVPLDGSRFAESALPSALTLSRLTGADVRLVIVAKPLPAVSYQLGDVVVLESADRYLNAVARRASQWTGGALTCHAVEGEVVHVLETEAEACKADIVVMATHGRGGLTHTWLGSVADAFLRHTSRPVLMVRPGEGEEASDITAEVSYGKILLPLDGSQESESVLGYAIDFGVLFGASYHLVRVIPAVRNVVSPYLPIVSESDPDALADARTDARKYLEERAERMRARGLEVGVSVRVESRVARGILQEAEARGCALIAMATHGRAGLKSVILGSTAERILRGVDVPLLCYRQHAVPREWRLTLPHEGPRSRAISERRRRIQERTDITGEQQ
jgi:nucleotide-binding universal stress UspA family protein